nr:unnamed protein product [Callosobruchus analis]
MTSQGPGDHTSPLQKLASFGGGGGGPGGGDPSAASMYGAAGAYGAGPPDGRGMGPPPHSAQANAYQRMVRPPPSAAGPATPQYPYQTDSMYSMPDVQVSSKIRFLGYYAGPQQTDKSKIIQTFNEYGVTVGGLGWSPLLLREKLLEYFESPPSWGSRSVKKSCSMLAFIRI